MNIEKITKDAFCVIGKAGSTNDGEGFVQRLWEDANSHFNEVSALAKKNEDGSLMGIWGIMTNFSFEFKPWENDFSTGLYLAGVEVKTDAVPPKGWKKWIVPGFEYLKVQVEGADTFERMIAYMKEKEIELVGAVQDFTDPASGLNYMLFPIAWNDSKLHMIREVKNQTNPVSVCTHHCEYCFMGEWCGGCRSSCNMCSLATMSENNTCENVSCAAEKGYTSCADCDELAECKKGFFGFGNGFTPKGTAAFVRKYGEEEYTEVLGRAIKAGLKYTEDLDNTGSAEGALELLERSREEK